MNFFRSLGDALIVAVFGSIVLGSTMGGDVGARHDIGSLIHGANAGLLAGAVRWVFLAASVGLLMALGFLAVMEERPLKSSA